MTRLVEVIAPSRLHFGMWSFGDPRQRQFGGVGAMIDRPGVRLRISPHHEWTVSGPSADRALEFAHRFLASAESSTLPGAKIEVLQAPAEHVGLGSGTQLALAVAAGLHALSDAAPLPAAELARRVGRAYRSAIGTHGFQRGGLLVEAGKLADDQVSPLLARVELPAAWRFVLARPSGSAGLSGEAERQAFARLPAVPLAATAEMCREVLHELLPAACQGRFQRFSESLYRYGKLAGLCFAEQQNGQFAGPAALPVIEAMRALGVAGVGQSSWGPTVFALLPDENQARDLVQQLPAAVGRLQLECHIAAPAARGATITTRDTDAAAKQTSNSNCASGDRM